MGRAVRRQLRWARRSLDQLQRAGTFFAFLFLVCGAARLARFNIQKNPQPRNPGKPNRKYFVGLPIPAAAGMVAAVVYAFDSYPITDIFPAILWLMLLALLSFLMVSTWRYWSFKDLNLLRPRSPLILVRDGRRHFGIWNWSQPVLLILASIYVGSGIAIRARRHYAAAFPAHAETESGDSGWLKPSHWSAAKRCWAREVARSARRDGARPAAAPGGGRGGRNRHTDGDRRQRRHFSPSWTRTRWKMRRS